MAQAKPAGAGAKRAKKVVEAEGIAHITATFNNTLITITDLQGNAITWGSSGKMREKRKVKRIYGLSERQFRNIFDRVLKEPGVTGEALLLALESRLDNLVYRMGFAVSRRQARQLVRHRHIQVNGRTVDIPSYRVRPGDEVRVADASRGLVLVKKALEQFVRAQSVCWIQLDTEKVLGKMTERPTRDAIPIAAQEQLIVELYSK